MLQSLTAALKKKNAVEVTLVKLRSHFLVDQKERQIIVIVYSGSSVMRASKIICEKPIRNSNL